MLGLPPLFAFSSDRLPVRLLNIILGSHFRGGALLLVERLGALDRRQCLGRDPLVGDE